jgi:hypothetical protein
MIQLSTSLAQVIDPPAAHDSVDNRHAATGIAAGFTWRLLLDNQS